MLYDETDLPYIIAPPLAGDMTDDIDVAIVYGLTFEG
jgi:hypothetical protein